MINNQYKGYKASHQVTNKIYSYTAPCSLDIDEMVITKENENNMFFKIIYYSKYPLILSVFVNATEYINCEFNLTEKIATSKFNSFEKHMLCKKGSNKQIKFDIPVNISELVNIPVNHNNPQILDQRYHMIIRIEPKEYKHRFVNMYYIEIEEKSNGIHFVVVKQKQEVEHKAFYIYDIFGLESLKKFKMNQDLLETFCTICMDNKIAVIIIPCRHMSLCLECAMLYNKKKPNGQPQMPPECPVCREKIKSFINIQGLKIGEEQLSFRDQLTFLWHDQKKNFFKLKKLLNKKNHRFLLFYLTIF